MASPVAVVRSASLHGYVELARALGLDAQAQLRRAGLAARSLDDPETPISAEAVRQLLEASAQASGAEDFGLRLASQRQLANLGPLSLVLREEPDARSALDTLCRYLRLLNASLLTRIEEEGGLVLIREDLLVAPLATTRQSMELAVGVMHRILRELLGPSWKPQRVCFMHRAPRAPQAHRAFFGAPVDFDQAFNGLVCRAADLKQPLHGANPEMARFARRYLEGALSSHASGGTPATVRQLIVALLPGGRCTAQQVAAHLHVDRRTLHRHLEREQTTFSELLQAVREELGLRQVRDSDQPLSEVAALLGFGSPSAFAHWFQTSFRVSASRLRRDPSASAAAPPRTAPRTSA